jgi:hypothetical protein
MVSSLFLQRQHQLTSIRPRLLRLSIVRILPKATIQVKKAIRGVVFTFQTLFQANSQDSPDYNFLIGNSQD